MNYEELKRDLFAALEERTSFGRNQIKDIINDVFLAAADKEIALLDPKQPKDYYEEAPTDVVDQRWPADNVPW